MKAAVDTDADLVVVGGGIVGLAIAARFGERFPERRVVVLEKEPTVCAHQTGRNSGVLHTGIYYQPGSSKARNCRRGKALVQSFCDEHRIPYELCGKVIVATETHQLERLAALEERARANGVECEPIDAERLREIEPGARGVRALHVPAAGIVDYRRVGAKLAELVRARGGTIALGARVTELEPHARRVDVKGPYAAVRAAHVVNCAGLHSDRVFALSGRPRPVRIVPFRGEYFVLAPEARHLVNHLIYPVPDPSFPFLGVHFTRRIDGSIECGPNAVLAFAREGYRKTDLDTTDLSDALGYPGFLRLARRYWRTGAAEMWRSISKRAFVRALQQLVPGVRAEHLTSAPSGIRAQALAPNGELVDDFLIEHEDRITHVLNAPSPAATSSLAIAETVLSELEPRLRG